MEDSIKKLRTECTIIDDLTSEERDDIRAFVNNEDGSYPTLADLPAWWDATDPDARAPELPFVERLIGTIRREYLDQTFFWNSLDLERKLNKFKEYYNQHRVHSSLEGNSPSEQCGGVHRKLISTDHYNWQSHCHDLFQTPVGPDLVIRRGQADLR